VKPANSKANNAYQYATASDGRTLASSSLCDLIQYFWNFSKVWYGNHLNKNWVKWSVNEAKDLFERFQLTNHIWDMPSDSGRF
jgi:hypothetical protein